MEKLESTLNSPVKPGSASKEEEIINEIKKSLENNEITEADLKELMEKEFDVSP
jgi:hypothetical protein